MWKTLKEEALHAGVIGANSFTGTGTDDLVVGGKPYFAASTTYKVEIDGTETFKWSNDNGSTWEATGIKIVAGEIHKLKNAELETEGIEIYFGSAAGHVLGDEWVFVTTGTVVSATAAAVGSIQTNSGCEGAILSGTYSKGTEDGLILYVVTAREHGASILNRPDRGTDIGVGGHTYYSEYFELTSSGNYSLRINLLGVKHYRIYQIRKGSTAVSGLFTCFSHTYAVI